MYSSSKILGMVKSRRMRWAGYVACKRTMRSSYNILVRNRPVGRPRQGAEDKMNTDLNLLLLLTQQTIVKLKGHAKSATELNKSHVSATTEMNMSCTSDV
jgi:hypothetical protein